MEIDPKQTRQKNGIIYKTTAGRLETLGFTRSAHLYIKPLAQISKYPIEFATDGDAKFNEKNWKFSMEEYLPDGKKLDDVIIPPGQIYVQKDKGEILREKISLSLRFAI